MTGRGETLINLYLARAPIPASRHRTYVPRISWNECRWKKHVSLFWNLLQCLLNHQNRQTWAKETDFVSDFDKRKTTFPCIWALTLCPAVLYVGNYHLVAVSAPPWLHLVFLLYWVREALCRHQMWPQGQSYFCSATLTSWVEWGPSRRCQTYECLTPDPWPLTLSATVVAVEK